jgi:hypothetical protein
MEVVKYHKQGVAMAEQYYAHNALEKYGYVLLDTNLDTDDLTKAQQAYKEIYKKAESGEYKYIRVYDDYLGKLNISGIEMPFHPDIIDSRIVNILNKTNIVEIAKECLGDNIKLTLSRYHITRDKSHIGMWHRDGEVGTKFSLLISLFLYDEKGFELIEGSHAREFTAEEEAILGQKYGLHANLKGSLHAQGKKGQLIVFNPAILHRGISENPRANLHFRFEVDNDYETISIPNPYGFNEQWHSVLSNKNSIVINPNVPEFLNKKFITNWIRKFIKTCVHYGIFFLPLNSFVYGSIGA